MTENETPLKLCRKWSEMAPGCFDTLDLLCKESHEDMGVSNVCDLPIGAAYEYLRVKCHLEKDGRARLASELTGLYIWQKHKVIYNFDHTLAKELVAQADAITEDDKIPTEILLRPPYPCVYIQTDKPISGNSLPLKFMAWIEEDANSHVREFRVQPFSDDMEHTKAFMLELTKPTVYDCIYDTVATTAKYHTFAKFQLNNIHIDESVRVVLRAMQLYLYVCSDQADIRENSKQKGIYRPRQPGQPIKDKFREIDMKDVGVVIGHTLRRAEGSGGFCGAVVRIQDVGVSAFQFHGQFHRLAEDAAAGIADGLTACGVDRIKRFAQTDCCHSRSLHFVMFLDIQYILVVPGLTVVVQIPSVGQEKVRIQQDTNQLIFDQIVVPFRKDGQPHRLHIKLRSVIRHDIKGIAQRNEHDILVRRRLGIGTGLPRDLYRSENFTDLG